MHSEVISGFDRPQGGSRYADKQPERKKGIPKRQAAGRRRRRDSRLLIWLLVILMTAAVCLAGGVDFFVVEGKTDRENAEVAGSDPGGSYET